MYWKFLTLQFCLISALALISGYQVPDLSQGNWDTTLFLTPLGIINNHLHKETSILWTFYSDISQGQITLSPGTQVLMLLVYVLLLGSVVYFIRKGNEKV